MFLGKALNLITVVTDGHSNKGEDPVGAAYSARKTGIIVNVVGILDHGCLGEKGRNEVKQIADAGGGTYQFITTDELTYTVQTLTIHAVRHQAETLVNRDLRRLTGKGLLNLPPVKRADYIPVLDRLEDETPVNLMLLIDVSGSMSRKKDMLEYSIRDLLISLAGRKGPVRLGIIQFPGRKTEACLLKSPDTNNFFTAAILKTISYGGLTPTGPAINMAAKSLTRDMTGAGYKKKRDII